MLTHKFSLNHQGLWLVVSSYLALLILKAPILFIEPRFWAEDGLIYYLQARNLPTWQALWAMPLGYLSLPPNLAGVLAVQLPLKYAPYASLFVSLSVQVLVLVVVLINGYFKQQRLIQLLVLIIPIAIVASYETWLNPINSQVWLALIAALVLASPLQQLSFKQHLFNGAILVLASLSGVVAAFLTPLFVLRAFLERRWAWLVYAALVSIGALLLISNGNHAGRSLDFPLELFAVRSFFQLILNNLCLSCSDWIFQQPQLLNADFFALASLLVLIFIYVLLWIQTHATGRWLLIASLVLLILSFAGALGKEQLAKLPPIYSARYFFAPACLIFMSALFVTGVRDNFFIKAILVSVFGFLLINSLMANNTLNVVGKLDGKTWKQSVAAFEHGESELIYFNQPFCGFDPQITKPYTEPSYQIKHANQQIQIQIPDLNTIKQPQIYFYRVADQHPSIFQVYHTTWQGTGLFFYGTPQYGQCYGGIDAQPAQGIQLQGSDTLLLDKTMLDNTQNYRYFLGYGGNFATMLAQGKFITLNSAKLQP